MVPSVQIVAVEAVAGGVTHGPDEVGVGVGCGVEVELEEDGEDGVGVGLRAHAAVVGADSGIGHLGKRY